MKCSSCPRRIPPNQSASLPATRNKPTPPPHHKQIRPHPHTTAPHTHPNHHHPRNSAEPDPHNPPQTPRTPPKTARNVTEVYPPALKNPFPPPQKIIPKPSAAVPYPTQPTTYQHRHPPQPATVFDVLAQHHPARVSALSIAGHVLERGDDCLGGTAQRCIRVSDDVDQLLRHQRDHCVEARHVLRGPQIPKQRPQGRFRL
jgi:hypothetical protein